MKNVDTVNNFCSLNKRNKKQQGVTLLTLIVTIVVMLILAGVTLNIALGDNGLIKKSKQAVNKSRLAQTEELIKMDFMAAYIEAELAGMDKPSNDTIKEIVEKHGGTIDEKDPNIIKTPNGDIRLDYIIDSSSSDSKDPEEINKTVEELNKQIADLKSQLESESTRRAGLEAQISELQAQVASWKKKAEDGEITIEEKNTEIGNLNDTITSKNQELDDKNNEIQSLNENITTITGQKNTLETQVANLQDQVNKKDEEIANKEEIIASKETTIASLNTRIEELDTSITNLNSQLDTVKADKQELEGQVTTLTNQKKSLDTQVANLQDQISNLNDQITAKNEEITTKTQTINDLNENVNTLTNEKRSLQSEVTSLELQVAKLLEKQATGDAVAANVLKGKTFSNGSGVGLTGTMPNNGDKTYEPEWYSLPSSRILTLPSGYYSSIKIDFNKVRQQGRDSVHPGVIAYREGGDSTTQPLERYTDYSNYSRVTITTPASDIRRTMNIIAIDVSSKGNIATSVFTQTGKPEGAHIYNYGASKPGTEITNLDDLKPNTKYIIQTKPASFEDIAQTAVYLVRDGYVDSGYPFPITD